jgi:hypothetical protein
MIALAVYVNRKKIAVAGADDLCVLNAIVNAVGTLGKSTAKVGKLRSTDLFLSVGGLTKRLDGAEDEHLRWTNHKRLRIGDKITIELVRTDQADKHVGSTVATRERAADAKRRLEKRMKANSKANAAALKAKKRASAARRSGSLVSSGRMNQRRTGI